MTDNLNPSIEWVLAAMAVSHVTGKKPLPPGLTEAVVGDWTLRLNNGKEQICDIPPFGIAAEHREYFAFAIFDPAGGALISYNEVRFIDDMRAALPPELVAEVLP